MTTQELNSAGPVDQVELTVNLFAGLTGPVLDVRVKRDGTGSWILPPELVRDHRTARGELERVEEAILDYLRTSQQHVPWPLPGHVPLAQPVAHSAAPWTVEPPSDPSRCRVADCDGGCLVRECPTCDTVLCSDHWHSELHEARHEGDPAPDWAQGWVWDRNVLRFVDPVLPYDDALKALCVAGCKPSISRFMPGCEEHDSEAVAVHSRTDHGAAGAETSRTDPRIEVTTPGTPADARGEERRSRRRRSA